MVEQSNAVDQQGRCDEDEALVEEAGSDAPDRRSSANHRSEVQPT
jgi:hypothetical protein